MNTVEDRQLRMRTHTVRLTSLLKMFSDMSDTQKELVFCSLIGMADCTFDDKNFKIIVEEMKVITGLSL